MSYNHQKSSNQTQLNNLLNPQAKVLNTPIRLGNRLPMRPPMSHKPKDSPATTTSFSLNNSGFLNSKPEPFTSRFLDFTPADTRQNANPNLPDFNLRTTAQHTPLQDRYKKTLHTNETCSEFSYSNKSSRIDTNIDELEQLRKQNQDLKRRLSLKVACSCHAPYVQEEVEYLRDCFYKHIETHHKEQIKK